MWRACVCAANGLDDLFRVAIRPWLEYIVKSQGLGQQEKLPRIGPQDFSQDFFRGR